MLTLGEAELGVSGNSAIFTTLKLVKKMKHLKFLSRILKKHLKKSIFPL